MNDNKNSRLMATPGDFYMAPSDSNTHSLTPEEIKADLETKTESARKGAYDIRKQLIKEHLVNQGINPDKVDVNFMLNSQQPSPRSNQGEQQLDAVRYFKINSGMIIKIVPENLLCYKFDAVKKVWIESPSLFVEFEQGNVHGEFIDFNDVYPIENVSDLSKGRVL